MKAVGFNQGQIGDLAMNLIACRAFKDLYPDSHLTFSINKKYESAAPIFLHNDLIDDIKIWENYDNWPSENDKKYLEENKFDKVFNPMPKHKYDNWYLQYHHTEAICLMHDLIPPKDLYIKLNKWFDLDDKYKNCVALTCFSSAGAVRDIPKEFANEIIDYIHSLGLETIQLGLNNHPRLNTTYEPISKGIFDDVRIALSCKFLLTTDTGMNWILSGYQAKVLGLYSALSYPTYAPIINRAPRNTNAIYLENYNIKDINFELIKQSINKLLE
jgi:ADP-heptose:LPS heptosyltransferase